MKKWGVTLSVPQYWSPPQHVTENGIHSIKNGRCFFGGMGEDLQMLEEKSGGTINTFLPPLLFLVVGVPKTGLEVAEEGRR